MARGRWVSKNVNLLNYKNHSNVRKGGCSDIFITFCVIKDS